MKSSTFRPAIVLLRSLRNSWMPCSICAPPAASGPVRTVRKPRRSGSCAAAVIAASASETSKISLIHCLPSGQSLTSQRYGQSRRSIHDVQLRTGFFFRSCRSKRETEEGRVIENRYPLPLPQSGGGGEGGAAQPGAV